MMDRLNDWTHSLGSRPFSGACITTLYGQEGRSLTAFVMESKAPKKPHRSKKCRIKAQEKFAKTFPYRFSWLTEPKPETLQSWDVKNNSLKDQLPLQKHLVPMRSIPTRGLGVPDFAFPVRGSPSPPLPLRLRWELKLLNLRFPGKLQVIVDQHYSNDVPRPSRVLF